MLTSPAFLKKHFIGIIPQTVFLTLQAGLQRAALPSLLGGSGGFYPREGAPGRLGAEAESLESPVQGLPRRLPGLGSLR